MKKRLLLLLLATVFVASCSKKEETFKLQEGTPAYQLAQKLSVVIPALDPQKNQMLVTTKYFNISSAEVIYALQENFGRRTEQLAEMPVDDLKKILMDNARGLTEKKLILRAADNAGVAVSQAEQDSLLNVQFNRYGGEEKYKQLLQQNDVDLEFVKSDMRNSLLIQHYFQEKVVNEIEISEQDILTAYQNDYQQDKYATVRHILLLTRGKNETEKAALRNKMEDIRRRAIKGEDFAQLAKQYTEDPGSKANGGLYENFQRGDMVKQFDEAAFTVPVGEISDIIETDYGYHILKVIDRKKETGNLDALRPKIVAQLRQEKEESTFKSHLEDLKTEAEYKQYDL